MNAAIQNDAAPGAQQQRTAARLAAVQALYQMDMGGGSAAKLIKEFTDHRLGRAVEGVDYSADAAFFADLVSGTAARLAEIDDLLTAHLAKGWTLARVEASIRQVLRAGCYELLARLDVPTAVVINEYMDIAHAFAAPDDTRFVNAVLDGIARSVRSA